MSVADCKFCERDCCDTDCSFADRHRDERRKTAAEWRAEGAVAMRAAVQSLRAELGPDGDPEVSREWLVARLDAILGPQPAPEPETIEVPVTRRARVTLVGRLEWSRSWMSAGILNETGEPLFLEPGARFVLRPYEGAPFRAGLGNVLSDGRLILGEIPAACHGDLVYRVEPS